MRSMVRADLDSLRLFWIRGWRWQTFNAWLDALTWENWGEWWKYRPWA